MAVSTVAFLLIIQNTWRAKCKSDKPNFCMLSETHYLMRHNIWQRTKASYLEKNRGTETYDFY